MNILILGATGRTGRLFAQAALSKNHQVKAIVRDKTNCWKVVYPVEQYLESIYGPWPAGATNSAV